MKRPQSVMSLQKVLLREKDPEISGKTGVIENLRETFMRLARPKI
jgi:hypothetical protein